MGTCLLMDLYAWLYSNWILTTRAARVVSRCLGEAGRDGHGRRGELLVRHVC